MKQLILHNYLIYRIRMNNLYIAISPDYQREIRQYVAEYQSLTAVPAHKMIKGLILRKTSTNIFELTQVEDTEIPVNTLDFDIGNVRLIA